MSSILLNCWTKRPRNPPKHKEYWLYVNAIWWFFFFIENISCFSFRINHAKETDGQHDLGLFNSTIPVCATQNPYAEGKFTTDLHIHAMVCQHTHTHTPHISWYVGSVPCELHEISIAVRGKYPLATKTFSDIMEASQCEARL